MKRLIGLTALVLVAVAPTAQAQFANVVSTYEVTITNITKDQRFTPVLVATHSRNSGACDDSRFGGRMR